MRKNIFIRLYTAGVRLYTLSVFLFIIIMAIFTVSCSAESPEIVYSDPWDGTTVE